MEESRESPPRGAPGGSAVEESRRLFREAERFEAAHEADRQLESLKRFLAHVEEHRRDLDEGSTEDSARALTLTGHPAARRLALARAREMRVHGFGLDLDLVAKGNNGHFAPFAWAA